MTRHSVVTLLLLIPLVTPPLLANATESGASDNEFWVATEQEMQQQPDSGMLGTASGEPTYVQFHTVQPCSTSSPLMNTHDGCVPADYCSDPEDVPWHLFGLPAAGGGWDFISTQCLGPGDAPEAAPAEVTPAIVLRALRRMGLPEVQARTQPEGTTLVNFDTIFYADASTQTRNVTLLGRLVTIEATPREFIWHHGDGTSRTTATAGAPYPAKDVVHRYARATGPGEQLAPRVDVTYSARFRVADGPWREIGETVTITGPPGALGVTEATPALTGASTG